MNCRICGSELELVDKIDNCISGHVPVSEKPYEIDLCSVDLYNCPNCGHFQIENLLNDRYYDDYQLLPESQKSYYTNQNRIVGDWIETLHGLNNGTSIIDIGCGKGDMLEEANRYYDKCVGVEASDRECEIARGKGFEIINTYFDENFDETEKYDAFISNMVFEHLDRPDIVLKKIYNILNENGVGFINIPDGEQIINQAIYHQIISEHVNYYSMLSIGKLAHDCGFEVVKIERDTRLLELHLYLRRKKSSLSMSKKIFEHKEKLSECLKEANSVIVWGGGSKASTYISLLEDIPIAGVVDSNDDKVGKYISGVKKPIQKASRENVINCDAIIIMASSYNDEIIASIKKFNYTGKIIYFEHKDNSIHLMRCEG